MSGKKRKEMEPPTEKELNSRLDRLLQARLDLLKGTPLPMEEFKRRLDALKEGQENLTFGRACPEYDWSCWEKKYRELQAYPITMYQKEKQKTLKLNPQLSPLSTLKLNELKKCFGFFSIPLNASLKELDRWFNQHPVLTEQELKKSGSLLYKTRFVDWICSGLTIPNPEKEIQFESKECSYLPKSLQFLSLKEREKQQIGPIRFFLRWFRALTEWSRQEKVHDALSEWSKSYGSLPLDFYITWSGNLFFQSVCEQNLLILLELIELATTYAKEIKNPLVCGGEITKFLQNVKEPCEQIRLKRQK